MGKAKKNLGLGLVCLALIFLFEPQSSIMDILPDFIGYLLMCIGLSQLADMNYHFEESLKYFKKMLAVSFAHVFVIFLSFGMITGRERPSALLLFTFIFSVVDVVFLTHAYHEFFEGFVYMGSRMEASAVFHISDAQQRRHELRREREEKRLERFNHARQQKHLPPLPEREHPPVKNLTARVARFTTLFVVLRAIVTVLPEFSALTEQVSDESAKFVFWYDYISLYREIAIAIVLPLGIVWLWKMIRYIRAIRSDAPFMQALIQKYKDEIEPKSHIFIQRAIKYAFVLIGIGVFFSIDFYVENYTFNVFPDTICPLFLFAALILLRKFVKIPLISYVSCVAYTGLSAFTYYHWFQFFNNFSLTLTEIRVEAYEAFHQLTILKITDSLVFLFMILSLLPVLIRIIKQYTGFAPISESNIQRDDKIRYVHSVLQKKLIIFAILALMAAAGSVCYILLAKVANFIWIIDFVICLSFSLYTLSALNAISEEVGYKYLLS